MSEDSSVSDDSNSKKANNSETNDTPPTLLQNEETYRQCLPEIPEQSTICSIKNEPSINTSDISETLTSIKLEDQKSIDKVENQENMMPKFEDEKAYKSWKKSISMVLSNITSHK